MDHFFNYVNQGCGLGRDVSVSRRSQDVSTSRDRLVSGLGLLRLVETFCAGARRGILLAAVRAILTSMTLCCGLDNSFTAFFYIFIYLFIIKQNYVMSVFFRHKMI